MNVELTLALSLERLEANSNKKVIRIGLSATISNLEDAARFVSGVGRKCAILVDKTIRDYDVDVKYVGGSVSNIARYILKYIKSHKISGSSPIIYKHKG